MIFCIQWDSNPQQPEPQVNKHIAVRSWHRKETLHVNVFKLSFFRFCSCEWFFVFKIKQFTNLSFVSHNWTNHIKHELTSQKVHNAIQRKLHHMPNCHKFWETNLCLLSDNPTNQQIGMLISVKPLQTYFVEVWSST